MSRFLSDNVSGIHLDIAEAVLAANGGTALPYGDDALSAALDGAFSELFETDVAVIPCTSGTAANALGLSLLAGPTSAVAVQESSHVYCDECNAPELFTGGARLMPDAGENGKLVPETLRAFVTRRGDRHSAQPQAFSLAQPNEVGAVYTRDEIRALGAVAVSERLGFHMDGARFGNAVATLGCAPADITWQSGVDILSFGATKNGCLAAEAVVIFDYALAEEARYRAKRAGQTISKMRFLSAQLLAYIGGGLWLECASHANSMAMELARRLNEAGASAANPDANIVFAHLTPDQSQRLAAHDMAGYATDGVMRFCTSWQTTNADLDALSAVLRMETR